MKRLYTALILLILFVLLWQGCKFYMNYNDLLENIEGYKRQETEFKMKRQKDSSTIVSQEATILTQDEAISMGLLKNAEDYGKINSQVQTVTRVEIDSVLVPYTPQNYADTSGWAYLYAQGDTADSIIDSVLANSVVVPKDFEKNEKWFTVNGQVTKEGVMLNKVVVPNETSVTVGYKKVGFMNLGRKPVVEITNSNPYLSTDNMRNVVIKPNKNIFNNKVFWVGVGILGGLYISTKF
jgi:hypothetical protein